MNLMANKEKDCHSDTRLLAGNNDSPRRCRERTWLAPFARQKRRFSPMSTPLISLGSPGARGIHPRNAVGTLLHSPSTMTATRNTNNVPPPGWPAVLRGRVKPPSVRGLGIVNREVQRRHDTFTRVWLNYSTLGRPTAHIPNLAVDLELAI